MTLAVFLHPKHPEWVEYGINGNDPRFYHKKHWMDIARYSCCLFLFDKWWDSRAGLLPVFSLSLSLFLTTLRYSSRVYNRCILAKTWVPWSWDWTSRSKYQQWLDSHQICWNLSFWSALCSSSFFQRGNSRDASDDSIFLSSKWSLISGKGCHDFVRNLYWIRSRSFHF